MTEAWTPKTADCAPAGRTTANIDGSAPYWTSYTYNEAKPASHRDRTHTSTGDKTTSYVYNDTTKDTKPHTLDKTTGARTAYYTYDSSGNTTSRPGPTGQQTLAWDSEGELSKVTEGTAQTGYLYDANGELLIRRASGDGDTILYFGNTEVRLTVKGTTKTVSGTRYYTANGQTIAVRTAVSGTSGTKLSFLASDHHGTSNVAIEAKHLRPDEALHHTLRRPTRPAAVRPLARRQGLPRRASRHEHRTHSHRGTRIRPGDRPVHQRRPAPRTRQAAEPQRLQLRTQRSGKQLRPQRHGRPRVSYRSS